MMYVWVPKVYVNWASGFIRKFLRRFRVVRSSPGRGPAKGRTKMVLSRYPETYGERETETYFSDEVYTERADAEKTVNLMAAEALAKLERMAGRLKTMAVETDDLTQ